jgi:hypothetical protein
MGQIVTMLIQFGFWLTPIFWSLKMVPERYHWIINLNPMVYIIEGYRDFCLKVIEQGYRNLFTPYAELYHHESISRGYETTPEKLARFQKEKGALGARHNEILKNGDPFYNPNLTHDKEDFSIAPRG